MKYLTIPPPSSISKYVRFFWELEGDASKKHPYIHRSMADGSAELVFHYNGIFDELLSDNKTFKSFTSGLDAQSNKVKRFSINQDFGIFGVYLFPYAIPKLFSIPALEVTNQMLDLKTLLGKNENGLEERIMLAKNTSERVEILSIFLEQQLLKSHTAPPGVFETINYIIQRKGTTNIDILSERNFLSRRQFERNFKRFSGFSPKVFSRIMRFQNVLQDLGSKKTLTQIGLDAGYADQSHFIREFKTFSGYTPKEYFLNKGEGTAWRETK
ncbi:helix-turn-helix domain-containing protein [Mariniflexile litorale]|uniref:Helix-turn-helix domain-containing protein n=1 Tax=Mariniflexile litorale TaxID=3045158 RepID=A0AAU7EHI2_9FLAO|nr:helix-turn-helix domain-containing protein [Mariniflexile sp. KMM 9835]MDQ8212027.1 helix-turn-helix domain-containing protein [Mariniflexile sp. KMM 9835]